jgi:uncharacterized protein
MMNPGEQDAAEAMRQRLQADLRLAMKGRVALDLAVLRLLIAAIDNAGSVPLSPESGPRQYEVERRRLSGKDVAAILWREYEVRQAASKEFARLGLSMESMQAAREMAVVGRYLSKPAISPWTSRRKG